APPPPLRSLPRARPAAPQACAGPGRGSRGARARAAGRAARRSPPAAWAAPRLVPGDPAGRPIRSARRCPPASPPRPRGCPGASKIPVSLLSCLGGVNELSLNPVIRIRPGRSWRLNPAYVGELRALRGARAKGFTGSDIFDVLGIEVDGVDIAAGVGEARVLQ